MDAAGLGTVLQKLYDLLSNHANLVSGVKGEAGSVRNELGMLKAILAQYNMNVGGDQVTKEWLRQLREVVHRVEDILEIFEFQATKQKARRKTMKVVKWPGDQLHTRSVAKEIKSIRTQVNKVMSLMNIIGPGSEIVQGGETRKNYPPTLNDDYVLVGFENEMNMIVSQLVSGSSCREVISIVGMGGIGKTALAKIVYTKIEITSKFDTRAWAYVFQGQVFLRISHHNDNMHTWSEEILGEDLQRHLRSDKKYLIVVDDVQTKEDWNKLEQYFPATNCGSRILLTSRNLNVAKHAIAKHGSPHHLRFLSEDESWELFCIKANCPPEQKEFGKKIAKTCSGLPLAIVDIAEKFLGIQRYQWKREAESVGSFFCHTPNKCMDVLARSYKQLPIYLKLCFIYFGVFPPHFEIPTWLLVRLWIAEGFIEPRGEKCLEDIAEEYLEDLIDSNLISVVKRRYDGQIKACQIHEMLRHLCLNESRDENYSQVQFPLASFSPPKYYRRLSIYSYGKDFISAKHLGPHVHSFLCFDSEDLRENTSVIFEDFELLRVLDIRSINLSNFPTEIKNLFLLRYIALHGNFTVLPKSISKLLNLQTLIIETISPNIVVEEGIWKLLQLRHLHTSQPILLQGPPDKAGKDNKNLLVLRNLQTISAMSPSSCTKDVLDRTPNLKKLEIRGKLVSLLEETDGSCLFDNLTKLDHLETLKLLNESFQQPPPTEDKPSGLSPFFKFPPHLKLSNERSQQAPPPPPIPPPPPKAKLPCLPPWEKFPPNLKELTLSHTLLEWEQMSTLGMLPNLEVLKLKDSAFTGKKWKALNHKGFHVLRVLQLGKTDLVQWEASSNDFPKLECLVLKQCESLDAIPYGLGDISTLKIVKLYSTSSSAAASARLFRKHHNTIKVFIHPPGL